MQKLTGCVRRAVTDYQMIENGDRIAVGLSGGKDSLMLLNLLARYQKYSPERFRLFAVMIDAGVPGVDPNEIDALKAHCEALNVPLHIVKTDIYEIVFEARKESNPCSLCSKMRRGALNTKCKELGANKLALGHHAEDVLDTFLLSFLYEGRLSTFQPISHMDRSGITLIRPLIYCREGDLKGAARRHNLPIVNNPCPMNHVTKREYVKNLVKRIGEDIPIAPDRMREAVLHPERYNLFPNRSGVQSSKKDSN